LKSKERSVPGRVTDRSQAGEIQNENFSANGVNGLDRASILWQE
jgi:hypothetical protein